ncbi:hypothetical protein N0V93_006228 [Gnomoniopsis smithogilvyi]|uniref:Uncharacterized protein n=1 Tax=Gnomoniopsis smithogilvyi TaxID=1191159 RepID=A0A9W8YRA7_9PEZI|nr:hypothetical protein N0V93_006228 [Gnomoniopsis smithogilvyi]
MPRSRRHGSQGIIDRPENLNSANVVFQTGVLQDLLTPVKNTSNNRMMISNFGDQAHCAKNVALNAKWKIKKIQGHVRESGSVRKRRRQTRRVREIKVYEREGVVATYPVLGNKLHFSAFK